MSNLRSAEKGRVARVIQEYGKCVELVPIDPNFQEISVGLYVKDGIGTIWTFSSKDGVEGRMEQIRDQLVRLGGLGVVEDTHNKLKFNCSNLHEKSLKFLLTMAVEKPAGYELPTGKTKDLRTDLMLGFSAEQVDKKWIYKLEVEGDAPNAAQRIRAVTRGLIRYGEMKETDDKSGVSFECGFRHDELVRLTLPYARNITGVEDQMAEEALRGQMTTGTLGFTPPT